MKSSEVEIGSAPPGWIVVATADSRSPLFLPEQAKMCESSLFTRGFTHFGSFRGKKNGTGTATPMPVHSPISFCAVIARPLAYEFCGFSQERGHRSPCDFTVEK